MAVNQPIIKSFDHFFFSLSVLSQRDFLNQSHMVNSVSVQAIRMKFQKASVMVSGTGMDVLVMALVAPLPISMRSPFLVALRKFSMCFRVSKNGASGAADPKDFPVKKSTVHGTASLARGTPPMGPPVAMT